MSTFAQETDNDLQLREGKLVLLTDVAEVAATALRNRFQFVKGEYFLDTRQGVPYFGLVFVKNPDLLLIKRLFRSIILATPGVASCPELTVEFDSAARVLSFDFLAIADNGKKIVGGSGQPFIVEEP